MSIIRNEPFTQTNNERKKEQKISKNGSVKTTGIRENIEGLDFCLSVKLFRALIIITMYIFD